MVQRYVNDQRGDGRSRLLPVGRPTARRVGRRGRSGQIQHGTWACGWRSTTASSLLHGRVSRAMFNELWADSTRCKADRPATGARPPGRRRSAAAAASWPGRTLCEPVVWQRLHQVDPAICGGSAHNWRVDAGGGRLARLRPEGARKRTKTPLCLVVTVGATC